MGYAKYLITSLLLLSIQNLNAQSVSTQMGSRSAGMGNASATLFDPWGIFNNIAGIAKIDAITIATANEIRPALPGANRVAVMAATKIKPGILGLGVFRFGDNLYSEQVVSLGFSNQFGLAALGTRLNYIQYRAEGFGSKSVVSADFGGIAELTPHFFVGASITNLNQARLSKEERLPTKMTIGIGLQPYDKVYISAEMEKDLDYDPTLKMGFEYIAHKKVTFRSGYNLKPNAAFAGMGFRTNKFQIDYSLQYSVTLNTTHQASISYQFKKS